MTLENPIRDVINYRVNDLIVHPSKKYKKRDLSDIDKIIIHHSATKNGKALSYSRYHVNNLNWPGIGYHFVADKDGLHQTNDLNTISYHTKGQNTNSIGICHTGNFDLRSPTDQEYWKYIQIVLYVDLLMGHQLPVHYHFDYSSKTCAGKLFNKSYFENTLKDFRLLFDYDNYKATCSYCHNSKTNKR